MVLPANNKFANKGAAPAAKPAPKAKPKPKKFGAPSDFTPRDPMLDAGFKGVVRHIEAEELTNEFTKGLSWRPKFEVVGEEENGTRVALFMNTVAGVAEFQRYCVAMAGYTDLQEFTEFTLAVMPDADAEEAGDAFFASVIGDANAFTEKGITIARRLVHVVVTRGNPVIDKKPGSPTFGQAKIDPKTGEPDYYRNYKWTVVDDTEQDEAGKLSAGE
jgi:hypothetical protein